MKSLVVDADRKLITPSDESAAPKLTRVFGCTAEYFSRYNKVITMEMIGNLQR